MNFLAHLYANMMAHPSDVLWNSFGFLGGAIFGIRFLIALVRREGWQIAFVPVNHRPRLTGTSKYTNFGRLLVSFHDLLGVRWLQRRYRGPAGTEEL